MAKIAPFNYNALRVIYWSIQHQNINYFVGLESYFMTNAGSNPIKIKNIMFSFSILSKKSLKWN